MALEQFVPQQEDQIPQRPMQPQQQISPLRQAVAGVQNAPNADYAQQIMQTMLHRANPANYDKLMGQQQQARQGVRDAMAKPVGEGKTFADYLLSSPGIYGNQWQTAAGIAGARQSQDMTAEMNRRREIDRAKYLSGELDKDETQMDKALVAARGALSAKNGQLSPEKLAGLKQSSIVSARQEFDPKVTPNMTPEERAQKINARAQELFLNAVEDLRSANANLPTGQALVAPNVASPTAPPVQAESAPTSPSNGEFTIRAEELETPEGRARLKAYYDSLRKKVVGLSMGSPEYDSISREMGALRKTGREFGFDPMTGVVPPKSSFRPKEGQTASEAGLTPVKFDQVKESPFAPALDLKPVLTSSLPQMQEKAIKADRDAYLKSDEFTGLNTQAAGAKELMKFVEAAIESPAKTNSLSGLNQMLNSYASAAGIPLDQKTKDQMLEFVKLNQTANAMGLVGQLMQRGVQTDKDFVRIMQAAFDTSLTPEQRRASMRQYADNLNSTITKQRYAEQYMNHPYSYGNERNWESEYSKLKQSGAPESVFMPNKKVLPYDEAAKTFWGTEQGSKYKPSKDDSPEEAKRKQILTIKALNAYNARMREKLKTGAE
jgi:hypothetical protein